MYEYRGRPSCTQMAAGVCHEFWVVVQDLQRVHLMVVCHSIQLIRLGGIQVDVMTVAHPVHW